jgi:hypothetical protein
MVYDGYMMETIILDIYIYYIAMENYQLVTSWLFNIAMENCP